jgi:hypothetical protein
MVNSLLAERWAVVSTLDACSWETMMAGMGVGGTNDHGPTWLFVVVGAVIGLALGVGVSITTDIPLAPEAGLLIGLLVGWLSHRVST